ncbi:unnamed protein product [Miscanthus lutarioriparius]|uniref:THH1/TOM1/TOM3 domain-containing protein n=1 Tax=Miscanthus lutarioriparius TaxID=422564 RepID=A0A811P7P4_9POAL|nr:unnamed protein product [Miscanthus lutarioriparius]
MAKLLCYLYAAAIAEALLPSPPPALPPRRRCSSPSPRGATFPAASASRGAAPNRVPAAAPPCPALAPPLPHAAPNDVPVCQSMTTGSTPRVPAAAPPCPALAPPLPHAAPNDVPVCQSMTTGSTPRVPTLSSRSRVRWSASSRLGCWLSRPRARRQRRPRSWPRWPWTGGETSTSRRCGRVTSSNFQALAVLYGIVFAVMLMQLIRKCRVPEYEWTMQKVFHFLGGCSNLHQGEISMA